MACVSSGAIGASRRDPVAPRGAARARRAAPRAWGRSKQAAAAAPAAAPAAAAQATAAAPVPTFMQRVAAGEPKALGAAGAGALALALALRAALGGKGGSKSALMDRGFIEEGGAQDGGEIEKALKAVNRQPMRELSEQQIIEARERRAMQFKDEGMPGAMKEYEEGDDFGETGDGLVTVPKDHPFASAEKLSEGDKEKMRRALKPRQRGRARRAAVEEEDST